MNDYADRGFDPHVARPPIQETGKRPTASLDRNLAYLSLVEILYGYLIDGVVAHQPLRQDHAFAADGGGDRGYSYHAVGSSSTMPR